MNLSPTEQDLARIHAALFAGQKIEAIKIYRACTHTRLADAKAWVDALEQELRASSPDSFTAAPGGKGCVSVLAFAALVGALGVAAAHAVATRV